VAASHGPRPPSNVQASPKRRLRPHAGRPALFAAIDESLVQTDSGPCGDAPVLRRTPAVRPHLFAGSVLIAGVFLAALFAPFLAPAAPDAVQPAFRLLAPSWAHPFGTDQFGRDLFSRVLFGARLALQVSAGGVLIAMIPGTLLGLIAGYRRGGLDQVLSRVIDVWMAFPGLLLAIVLVARLGPSLRTTVIALGIVGVPWFYRLARNGALSAGCSLYIEAARATGASEPRILLRHILPNLSSSVIVLCSLRLGTVLLAIGGLSFIGLGAQPPEPEWGALLATGREYLDTAWWLALFPGIALTVTVMGFNLLGDGLRDLLAPGVG
jgi:ABC-type dipeptide/oligopeptide/nickel transport system permease subunit